jgi:hypothetical protein
VTQAESASLALAEKGLRSGRTLADLADCTLLRIDTALENDTSFSLTPMNGEETGAGRG